MTLIEKNDETHGKDEIILSVYKSEENKFTFSVQCHLGDLTRAIFPHAHKQSFSTERAAKKAAVSLLYDWVGHSKKNRERLEKFYSLEVEQLEFDFG